MDKVMCNLTNCYGIKNLQYEFDFSNTNAICVYARNGLMKISFSKTFKKIQKGKASEIKDEIFDLDGIAEVKVDGVDILPKNIFVINSNFAHRFLPMNLENSIPGSYSVVNVLFIA